MALGLVVLVGVGVEAQRAPSFHSDFARHLTAQNEDEFGRRE